MLIGYRGGTPKLARRFRQLLHKQTFQLVEGENWAVAAIDGSEIRRIRRTDGETVGLVVGQMVVRTSGKAEPTMAPSVLDAQGIVRAWGSFTAIWHDSAKDQHHLFVDPLARGELFVTGDWRRGWAFGSSLAATVVLAGSGAEPDWEVLGDALRGRGVSYRQIAAGRTAIAGVRKLELGQCGVLGESKFEVRQVWDPVALATQARAQQDPAKVRQLLADCVKFWSDGVGLTTVELSGGLDSSAVAWGAAQHGDTQAVHVDASRLSTEAREFHYAAEVAKWLGIPLIRVDAEDVLPFAPHDQAIPLPPRPHLAVFLGRHNAVLAEIAGGGITLTGEGGDQIFGYGSDTAWIHDLLLGGHTRQAISTLGMVAYYSGEPVWSLARQLFSAERARWRGFDTLASASTDTLPPPTWLNSSWLREHEGKDRASGESRTPVGAGRAEHIISLARFSAVAGSLSTRGAAWRHPLFSLPLVEFALRTPMWQLMNVDVDRPLLRDALRGDLPTSVIERRDKSSQSASWIIGLRRYADAARDLIGDGICARVGAIDVDEAIRALDGVVVGDHSRIGVLELLAVERWLQLWQPLRSGGNLT